MQYTLSGKNIYRAGIYFAGMVTVSAGIVLCVKCGLGISPISSVPYVLSLITPLSFGTATMLFHLANTLFQYIAEGKRLNMKVLLQIPIAFLFGVIIDFTKALMNFQAENILFKISLMILSIVLTALGMHMMLSVRLVQNPPDGTVKLMAEKLGKETGTVKIYYDISMTSISILLGWVVLHRIEGFGIATLMSAVFVGKTLTVFRKKLPEVFCKF